ncbi:starch-binding domain-containing protein 1 [Heteronotia binoei]|uniref:starch-binding domain-containing protein 1 n=1 Tax=Heteronotia binoei TaxID=13085 RepID=UPI00292EAE6E|nr:starch-binding domain-containing protein 1 [Heteronotia binoei]
MAQQGGRGDGARAALSLDEEGGGPLAGLWPAFVVALVAAVVAWLWYGGKGEKKEAAAATAAAQAGSPLPPPYREAAPGEGPHWGSYNRPASETKPNDVSACWEPARNPLVSPGEHSIPRETPESEPVVKEPVSPLTNCKEPPRNETFDFPAAASEPPQTEETDTGGTGTSAEAGAPGNPHPLKRREKLQHNSLDHDWEIVPEHSAWGDTTRNVGPEDASGSKDPEQAKRVAAVSPMPQTVHVTFRVHYITYSETQLIAVTGDHECLGQWQHYAPLKCEKDGFWSDSVAFPVDTRVEWKFIVVENGKVRRWEECDNRTLMTEHEDRVVHKWWGYH